MAKTLESLVQDIFVKEGDVYTEPPTIDQPTGRGGITLEVYKRFVLDHGTWSIEPRPDQLKEGLRTLSRAQAETIVRWYLQTISHQCGLVAITDELVRTQMLDFAYNSGPALAIRWLQRCLRVPRTGVMDARTIQALAHQDGFLLNQALIAARLQMIDLSTDGGSIDKKFEEGLESRALTFSLLDVP